MKIGFDVSQTGKNKAGCGYFADSLIQHLAEIDADNEYLLYPTFGGCYWDPDWRRSTRQINRPNFARGLGHVTFEAARLFWSSPPRGVDAQLGNPDIIHSNNFFCPPGMGNARLVYTLYDLGFLRHPEWSTEENRTCCFSGVFNASLYADLIIAISQHTRRDLLDLFPHYPADQVEVVYPASRFTARENLAKPKSLPQLQSEEFWLTVSTLEPRKNHLRLLEAYSRLKAHLGSTFRLVLAGAQGWLMDDFDRTIEDMGLRRDVILLGYVDDPALQWLYQDCFAFLYPSLFEGFGLPVVEAMTLGAPVICSDTTSLPEIVGSAGLLVDPYDEDEIFRAMLELSQGEVSRQALKEASIRRARRFSWTRTASEVLGLYQQLAAQPRPLAPQCSELPSDLWDVYSTWNELGEEDPLWAVLTWPDKRGGRWPPEQFFETGRTDVHNMLLHLESLGNRLNYGVALDFGCGVGRLTQALADQGFREVHGVDIAPSMIEQAEKLNRHVGKCFFHLNLADDLRFLDDDSFDLVMSMITLQHVPKRHALRYIADFVRVARPGGLIVFQVPDSMRRRKPGAAQSNKGALPEPGSTRDEPEMIMSGISYAEVTELLEACGAQLLDAVEDQYAGPEWLSYKYYATKKVTAS